MSLARTNTRRAHNENALLARALQRRPDHLVQPLGVRAEVHARREIALSEDVGSIGQLHHRAARAHRVGARRHADASIWELAPKRHRVRRSGQC